MAKKNETYNDVAHENDSRKMMEHINSKNAEYEATEEGRSLKQYEEREKIRLNAIGRYTLRCVVTLIAVFALYKAMNVGLISSVLVTPATYLCAVHFGWCWCKVVSLAKKGRGSK